MKTTIPLALLFVAVLLGGVWLTYGPRTFVVPSPVIATTTASGPTSTPVTTPSPAPTTYTLADVAKHASASDCWTTINGSVYNLTSFIPVHPGGSRILVVCGRDGTSAFEAQHSQTAQAQAELARLKIGTLAP